MLKKSVITPLAGFKRDPKSGAYIAVTTSSLEQRASLKAQQARLEKLEAAVAALQKQVDLLTPKQRDKSNKAEGK